MMRAILSLLLILFLGLGCATAQRGAMLRARSGIEKGKYAFALHRLNEAEDYTAPTPKLKAEMLYLKGICYRGLGQHAEADALFNHVIEKYSESEYAALAKAQIRQ